MGIATIGALRAVLGIDTAQFDDGLDAAQKQLRQAGREFEKVGRQISSIGKSLTMGITLPVLGMGTAVVKTAADFETAMNRVGISTGAASDKLEAMAALARQIGKDTVFSATEAADAMDMLAKAGVSVEDILGGAARAAVDLAAAAGTELDPAAAAITDTMAQFHQTAAQLPAVVNQITGAVNESKLDFVDFQQAMGQAGGVAANLGVSFEDFNAVLAGTSPLFSSGSDAGTSFKTFLQRLVPTTQGAATAIEELGLNFHDAEGNLRPMSDIAQQLQDKLKGLSDQAKTQYLTEIFGTDAMRTAIALMDKGAAGLDNIRERIAATDAAAQAAKRMEGFSGQLQQLGGAFEEAAIAIGESGLLAMVTGVVAAFADMLTHISEVSPVMLQIGVVFAGLAAAIGPALIVVGSMVSAWGALATALASGGIMAGLAGFAVAAAPFVAAAAAIAAAIWVFRDDLMPVFEQFAQAAQEALGPAIQEAVKGAQAAFTALGPAVTAVVNLLGPILAGLTKAFLYAFGPIVLTALRVLVAGIGSAFSLIGKTLNVLTALLMGDWKGAWTAAGSWVMEVVRSVGRLIDAVFPGATRVIGEMVRGVTGWLQGKLFDVLGGVIRRVKDVSDAFFKLYDAVVGHSYVPDMVTEVGQWMGRLQQAMVEPAQRATSKAAQAFQDLRTEANAIMRSLLTDQEKAWLEHQERRGALLKAIEAGGADADVYRRGLAIEDQNYRSQVSAWQAGELLPDRQLSDADGSKPPALQQWLDTIEASKRAISNAREDFADAFSYGIEAALDGDWSSLLRTTLQSVFGDVLKNVGRSLFDGLSGILGNSKGGGLNWGSMFSSLFSGLPKFANEGTIRAGGGGGIDSQLVSFWKSPSEQVDIYDPSNHRGSGGSGSVIQNFYTSLKGAVVTEDLLRSMDERADAARRAAVAEAGQAAPIQTIDFMQKRQMLPY